MEDDDELVGRPLWREGVTERLPGRGRQTLLLSRWPIEDDPPVVTIIDHGDVDIDLYSVTGTNRHALVHETRWRLAADRVDALTREPVFPILGLYYSISYTAGYLMPGQVSTWTSSTPWGVGQSVSYGAGTEYGWARATDRTVQFRFEVTDGSGTVLTEPTWPTVVDGEVTAGTVTFTARAAFDLPPYVSSAARTLAEIVDDRDPRTVVEDELADMSTKYAPDGSDSTWRNVPARLRGVR